MTNRIGVHYWNDHEWGESYATLRVYYSGVLVYQAEDVELKMLDLWEVATIDWPSGAVTPVVGPDGEHKIVPDYVHPLFGGP